MKRTGLICPLVICGSLLLGCITGGKSYAAAGEPSPNILFIMADDLSMNDIAPYGSTGVYTPNMQRLAKEGMCFDNMFNLVPVCSPTRQSLLTGLGPVRNGAWPNHSRIYDGIKTLPVYMKELGYNVALLGKRHYAPAAAYPFDFLGGRDQDNGEGQDVDLSRAEKYIRESSGKPFFLMFTSNQPHAPWNRGDQKMYDPQKIRLHPNMVDTKLTREQMAAYFAEITYLDSLVGACLDIIERSGQKENTVVMFATEQGNSFPFSKWTLYDQGLRSGFIVRWPGIVKPHTRSEALLQYTDILPTLIDIAGGHPDKINTGSKDVYGYTGFDGASFKGLLTGKGARTREYVYGINTTRGIINGSDAYASRSARSKDLLYIHNLNYRVDYSNYVAGSDLFKGWMKKDSLRASLYITRPEEELYDIVKDPYQLKNLALDRRYSKDKTRLRNKLEGFMKQQGDKGVQTEMEAFSRQPGHRQRKEPPNVILILMDDMGYGDLSCYGALGYRTPNLDRMANEGMRFTSFLAPQAVCTASRAGMLTGCYPNRINMSGVLFPSAEKGLNPDETTLAELFKQKGYSTAMYGKWHLGDQELFLPLQHGFDEYFGLPYSNDMWPVDFDGQPAKPNSFRYKYPPLFLMEGNKKVQEVKTMEDQAQLTRLYTEHAVQFIKKNKKKPFFLYLPYSMPHAPIAASEKFRGKSQAGLYGDVMMEADASVGELFKTLEEEGVDSNTLVIFLSDNGPWRNYGNHAGSAGGLREGKQTIFEGGQRIPCIMKWKGKIPAGYICNGLASAIDILPTLASICNLPLPAAKIDGLNITDLITGKTEISPRRYFYYYFNENSLKAVRRDNWKLVFPHRSNSYEKSVPGKDGVPGKVLQASFPQALYDLREDPAERYDLQALYPEIVKELEQVAEKAREDLGDDLTDRQGTDRRPAGMIKNK